MTTPDPGAQPRLPTIRRLRAQAPRLVIGWLGGGSDTIDFSGLIARDALFAPLADPALFNAAEIIDFGIAVGWDDKRELSGATLKRMADAQRPMTAPEFAAFQSANNISNAETATLIARGLTAVKEYKSGRQAIPATVAAMVRTMADDPIIFAAHYRPTAPAGRPRKSA